MDIFLVVLFYTGIFLLIFFSCLLIVRLITITPMQALGGAGMIRCKEERATHRMRPMANKEVQTAMMGNSPHRAGIRFM